MFTIPSFSHPLPGAGGSLNIRRAAASVGTGGHWFCGEVLGPWERCGGGVRRRRDGGPHAPQGGLSPPRPGLAVSAALWAGLRRGPGPHRLQHRGRQKVFLPTELYSTIKGRK